MIWDRIALALVIIGALNWGAIGLFGFHLRRADGRPLPCDLHSRRDRGPVVRITAVPGKRHWRGNGLTPWPCIRLHAPGALLPVSQRHPAHGARTAAGNCGCLQAVKESGR